MKFAKRLSALALALSLCGAAALPAYAHDVPDETRTGSVSFAMTYDGAAVGGGSLTLYRVGDVAEDNGNYSFALSDAYEGCAGVDLGALSDMESVDLPGVAQTLADYTTVSLAEGIGHTTTEDELVHLTQQVLNDANLGRHLGTTHDGNKGTLDVAQHVVHSLYFLLHQIAQHLVVGIEIVSDDSGGGMLAVAVPKASIT